MKTFRFFLLAGTAFVLAHPALAQDERPYNGYGGNGSTNTEMRFSAQENEIRALNGHLEQMDFAMRRLEQTMQRLQNDVDARLAKMEAAQAAAAQAAAQASVAPPPAAQVPPAGQAVQPPVAPQAQVQTPAEANGTLGALKLQNGKITGGVNKPQSTPLPAVPGDYGLTPQEQYERAFNFLREADYTEAEEAFKNFIDKNPKDKLLDNAKYWYGETLYVRTRFDEAAVAFADAYQQNPKGSKAPDSLLKLGLSLVALNKTPDACVTFNELKAKYPNAAPTVKSRVDDERAKLKCSAQR